MKLFTCVKSRGFRVSWAAEEIGLQLDYEIMPFPPRHTQPEYLEINPLGTVPMLIDGETKMTESCAIVHYLASKYGADLLLKPDHPDYGEMLDWSYHADATLTFPQTVYMRFGMFESKRGLEEAGELYFKWFLARLAKIESRLKTHEYLCGNRFTIADINVGYALYLTKAIGRDSELSARAKEYLDRLQTRASFQAAMKNEMLIAKENGAV